MKLSFSKNHPHAIESKYANGTATCFDIYAVEVNGGGDFMTNICRTGLSFYVPPGWAMLLLGLGHHGMQSDVRLANCVGVVNAHDHKEVVIKLTRDRPWAEDEMPRLLVRAGDRIAQAMLVPAPHVTFELIRPNQPSTCLESETES